MRLTVRERVIASRLIQKVENNDHYAKQIGLSYELRRVKTTESINYEKRKQRLIT